MEHIHAVVFLDVIHYHVRGEGQIVKEASTLPSGSTWTGRIISPFILPVDGGFLMSDFCLSCCSTVDLSPEWVKKRDLRYVRFRYTLDGTE